MPSIHPSAHLLFLVRPLPPVFKHPLSPSTPLPLTSTSLSPPSLSTVASTAASNLTASIAAWLRPVESQFPSFLRSEHLRPTLARAFSTLSPPLQKQLSGFSEQTPYLLPGLITTLLVLASMAGSWHRQFWGRPSWSPFSSRRSQGTYPTPQVNDEDYSYITDTDLQSPPRVYDPVPHRMPHSPRGHGGISPTLGPDILVCRHRGVVYPLHFPTYSIDDGVLRVGDLRQEAARKLDVRDPRYIKLIYKGRALKDDARQCREEGLKVDSELMCIVGDQPDTSLSRGDGDSAEVSSGSDDDDDESSVGLGVDTANGSAGSKSKKKRRNHRSGKKKDRSKTSTPQPGGSSAHLPPPPHSPRPTSAPQTPQTPLDKLNAISSTFNTTLLPQCIAYTSNPPVDAAKREYEHRKLAETIMGQVLLKLDAVEVEGDPDARAKRKELVREVQRVLTGLDEAEKAGAEAANKD